MPPVHPTAAYKAFSYNDERIFADNLLAGWGTRM